MLCRYWSYSYCVWSFLRCWENCWNYSNCSVSWSCRFEVRLDWAEPISAGKCGLYSTRKSPLCSRRWRDWTLFTVHMLMLFWEYTVRSSSEGDFDALTSCLIIKLVCSSLGERSLDFNGRGYLCCRTGTFGLSKYAAYFLESRCFKPVLNKICWISDLGATSWAFGLYSFSDFFDALISILTSSLRWSVSLSKCDGISCPLLSLIYMLWPS